jgi:O-antigen/teichoic acid export membrane protein
MFNEIKTIFRHYLIYSFGNLASKAIGFLMIPVYTRYLTPDDYGIIEILTITSSIVSNILILGLSSAVLRFYFNYNSIRDKNKVVSTALTFTLITTFLAVAFLYNFSKNISFLVFNSQRYFYLFQVLFVTLFFEISVAIPYMYLRAKDKSVMFTTISLLQLVLGLSFNIWFIVGLRLGVLGVLFSSLLSNLLISSFMLLFVFRDVGLHFSVNKLKEMMPYGIPLIPANLAMIVLNMGDRFLLQHFCSLQEVGLYSLGYRFAMMIGVLVGQPFLRVWNTHMFLIAERNDASEIYSRVLVYYSFILLFFGLGVSVLIKDILKIMATPEFFDAHKVVPFVVLGYIFYEVYYIFTVGIYLKKHTKWIAFIVSFATGLNILLNLLMIPKFGMMGAASVTALSFFCLPLSAYFLSNRLYHISFEFERVVKLIFVALIIYFAGSLIDIESILLSLLLKTILILTYPIILYFFSFYEAKEIEKAIDMFRLARIKFHFITSKVI